jgi:hypothetical protein
MFRCPLIYISLIFKRSAPSRICVFPRSEERQRSDSLSRILIAQNPCQKLFASLQLLCSLNSINGFRDYPMRRGAVKPLVTGTGAGDPSSDNGSRANIVAAVAALTLKKCSAIFTRRKVMLRPRGVVTRENQCDQ